MDHQPPTKKHDRVAQAEGQRTRTAPYTYRVSFVFFFEGGVKPFFSLPIVKRVSKGLGREIVGVVAPGFPRADADVANDVFAGGVQRGDRVSDLCGIWQGREQAARPAGRAQTRQNEKTQPAW